MDKESTKIPNSLRLYRRKRGLSQKYIARLLGYRSTSAVSSYERGTKAPQLINLLKLEIIYRIPVSFLYWDHYQWLREELRAKEERLRLCQQKAAGAKS